MARKIQSANTTKPRFSFGKIKFKREMPDLIKVQKDSYKDFLQKEVEAEKREEQGLQAVFKSVFPIADYSGQADLEFVDYSFDKPKYDVEECITKGLTFSAPMKVKLRLIIWDLNEEEKTRSIRDIKEQEVFMGDVPLMTEKGTFIFNGTERVVVSQMQRSPGVFYDHDKGKTHPSGKLLYSARVIPDRGSWLDFEFDAKDILYVRIDKKRKLPATTLVYALPADEEGRSYSANDILKMFYPVKTYKKDGNYWKTDFKPGAVKRSVKVQFDYLDSKSGDVVLKAGAKLSPRRAKKMFDEGFKSYKITEASLIGRYISDDFVDETTGEVLIEAGDEITEENLKLLKENKVKDLPILMIDEVNIGSHIRNTIKVDKNTSREEALVDIYHVMRPGEPPTLEAAENLFQSLFFDPEKYDLSKVGRFKMNLRLDIPFEEAGEDQRTLRKEDIIKTMQVLLDLKDSYGPGDDIDNLGNRRVRSVGELLENQFRIGLVRMERSIKERMSSVDIDRVMPQDLINAKSMVSIIKEFFGMSQLSKFMDQTNPLSEITDKRRISALGPGGLTRERAGFEVRDVHPTHYGRICPIETPEGQNIGLINSLSSYAEINRYGFIETPYRKVENGKVSDEVVYISALEEHKYTIAQANTPLNDDNTFALDQINSRQGGEFTLVDPEEVDLMDVSPKQIVSIAAALIPFLENTDANRALMGSNMQRQAVPLLQTEAPMIGTGVEGKVATDSKATVLAEHDGIVKQVDASRIVIESKGDIEKGEDVVKIYKLSKFKRSNQNTCINQKPLVKVGDHVKQGDIIADGPCTHRGELALGKNVKVAFMPWNGYNFEDSIVISEKVVRDDVFTSIHVEEFEVVTRDTKLGPEEITRDIPNVSESALSRLDEVGIVHVGAKVKPGDILVGKVTPKGESLITPEEKLLRAIFGEKAADVRDTSMRVPSGTEGVVVDVKTFTRKGVEKDERSLALEYAEMERLKKDRDDQRKIIEAGFAEKIKEIVLGKKLAADIKDKAKKGKEITEELLDDLPKSQWKKISVADEKAMSKLEKLHKELDLAVEKINKWYDDQVEKLRSGDELPQGVLKMVKVFIAVKRKLQRGDKMAGRHGNKGVISKILPVEDMPYTEDGTPVDIVLNPHGLPSRMNFGQILETHLGWACKGLGEQIGKMLEEYRKSKDNLDKIKNKLKDIYGDDFYKEHFAKLNNDELLEAAEKAQEGITISTPVFDGAKESDINDMLKEAELPTVGQVELYNGLTGEKFDRPVTVGYIYMIKLYHLVDEKIHARSVGPYSLVTQQPLGGKAQFGGQRFGEMEVWALEAYGASYTLQEMLTVKSDDVSGRTKVYESIVRGNNEFEAGLPESFNVLIKELKSLGLNVELKE